MSVVSYYRKLPLSKRLYYATAIGLFLGIFFGNKCSILEPLNTIAIKVFQITIIPYMVFSLIQSIGSMTGENAKLIGKKGGIILISIWAISIFYAFGLHFSFPDIVRSKFFQPESALGSTGVNFYDLFIPTNPFYSLANGYIPAIVIFFILAGITLIHEERKAKVIELAQILALMMKKMNDYIMILLPFGVLVMSTFTFGTLCFMTFKGVLLYIIASIFYLVCMSMIIYPGIIVCVSNINYRKFMHYAMPAAIVAFTTGSVFLALPVIYNQMYHFDDDEKGYCLLGENQNDKGHCLISILVPLAWVVPASYKFLVIFFIIFENWYYDTSIGPLSQLFAYIGGIPCLFGSNSVIVPFLLNITGLPNKAYDIFMIVSSITVYFNNANGAIFIIVSSMLCYLALNSKLKISWSKLIAVLIVATLFFSVFVMGLSRLMTIILTGDDEVREELTHMNLHTFDKGFASNINIEYSNFDKYHYIEPLNEYESQLDKVVRTGILQVGYNPEAVPFSFFNANGELIGYDIDFIYEIAVNLSCNKIEFYPVYNSVDFEKYLKNGQHLDICVGGFIYKSSIREKTISSEPYMNLTSAIVLPDKYKDKFPDELSAILLENISFGILEQTVIPNNSISERITSEHAVVELSRFSDFYTKHKSDALITGAEIASAIGILNPGYWVCYYKGSDIKLFYAYIMPYSDKTQSFCNMINVWIDVCYKNGVQKKRYDYWIMGEADVEVKEPWSVLSWLQKNNYFVTKNRQLQE
ncbi:MAG: cation:dicarboxylase symporter family transporter [Lentisphaerota bacterium]